MCEDLFNIGGFLSTRPVFRWKPPVESFASTWVVRFRLQKLIDRCDEVKELLLKAEKGEEFWLHNLFGIALTFRGAVPTRLPHEQRTPFATAFFPWCCLWKAIVRFTFLVLLFYWLFLRSLHSQHTMISAGALDFFVSLLNLIYEMWSWRQFNFELSFRHVHVNNFKKMQFYFRFSSKTNKRMSAYFLYRLGWSNIA